MAATTVERSLRVRPLAIGILSIALAIWAQGFVAGHEYLYDGLLLYAVSLMLGVRVLDLPSPTGPTDEGVGAITSAEARRWRIDRAVIIAGGFVVAANLLALRLFATNSNPSMAWLLYGSSVVAAPFTVWLATGRHRPRLAKGWGLNDVAALVLVLLVAAAFRLFRIDSLPFGLWWDEASYGLQVLHIMNDPGYRPVFVGGASQMPSLMWYVMVPFLAVFGPTSLGLRMASVAAGLLGVLAIYLLARELFGKRTAFISGLLIAMMVWHVNWSRIGMAGVWSVALDALAAFFLIRAMRTGSPGSFALAGTMLGLGLNMYFTSRLLPLVLAIYVTHRLVAGRGAFFKRHLAGLLVFAVTSLVTVSPLAEYAVQHPAEFSSRTDTVSVLKEVSDSQSYQPIIENLRKHLLMFQYEGDRNGRQNLPGAPMLDQVTAALFGLGLMMALLQITRRESFFLVTWFAVMLAGGVFSLSFEAPQGYRTIEEVTGIAILSALPLSSIWGKLEQSFRSELRLLLPFGGSRFHQLSLPVAGLAILALLGLAGVLNYQRYFVQQATDSGSWGAFSAAETEIGREVKTLGPGYQIYLGETFVGHPTIEFLTGRKDFPKFDSAGLLPLRDNQNVAIFLEPQRSESMALMRRLYPQAEFRTTSPPAGGSPVLLSAIIQAKDIAALRGMVASYYGNDSWAGEPLKTERTGSLDVDWRDPQLPKTPFSVGWKATLAAPSYGQYVFRLNGPSTAELAVDGTSVTTGGSQGSVTLAKGNHALAVRAVVNEKATMGLMWQPPGAGTATPIPPELLFAAPVVNNGLLGSYYRNKDWSGAPDFQQVDPQMDLRFHLLPLPRPYSVEWKGKIDVPASGIYRFATESADISWVYVNDRLVVTNEGANRQLREGTIQLEQGLQDIRIRFYDETSYTFIRVFWTPPGGQREILPIDRLYPPQGKYPPPRGVNISSLAPAGVPSLAPGGSTPSPLASGSVRAEFAQALTSGGSGLTDPRDMVPASDGRVYVADAAGKAVQLFSPQGAPAGRLLSELVQPFGVAVAPDGRIVVLDSLGKDPLVVFDAEGKVVGRMGAQLGTYNPRGLFIDPSGSIYLADTGRGRVLKLSSAGQVVAQFRAGGHLKQPVSVAVAGDGALYIVDPDTHQLWVVDPGDRVLRQWAIPQSTTFDAPHVALGPRGEVYVSDPAGGTVRIYDGLGTGIGQLGGPGSGDGQFRLPTGLRVDGQGNLWVADTLNMRVQRWVIR